MIDLTELINDPKVQKKLIKSVKQSIECAFEDVYFDDLGGDINEQIEKSLSKHIKPLIDGYVKEHAGEILEAKFKQSLGL